MMMEARSFEGNLGKKKTRDLSVASLQIYKDETST